MPIRVEVDERVIAELARRPEILGAVRERVAEPLADYMAAIAPKATGAAAGSIHVDPLPGRPGWAVSWDTRHTYIGILNKRLRFAELAAARFGGRS